MSALLFIYFLKYLLISCFTPSLRCGRAGVLAISYSLFLLVIGQFNDHRSAIGLPCHQQPTRTNRPDGFIRARKGTFGLVINRSSVIRYSLFVIQKLSEHILQNSTISVIFNVYQRIQSGYGFKFDTFTIFFFRHDVH